MPNPLAHTKYRRIHGRKFAISWKSMGMAVDPTGFHCSEVFIELRELTSSVEIYHRWMMPDGKTFYAPAPGGVKEEYRRVTRTHASRLAKRHFKEPHMKEAAAWWFELLQGDISHLILEAAL